MSDKMNITKLLALRDAYDKLPSNATGHAKLNAKYAYTKAVMDAADVLLEVAASGLHFDQASGGYFDDHGVECDAFKRNLERVTL